MNKRSNLFLLIFLSLLLTPVLMNCGGGHESSPVSTTVGSLDVGSVATLDLEGSGSGEINFEDLHGYEQFILSISSVSQNAGSNSISVATSSGEAISWKVDSLSNGGEFIKKGSEEILDSTSAFHENLRKVENNLALFMNPGSSDESGGRSSRLSLDADVTSACAGRNQHSQGQVVQLKVLTTLDASRYETRNFDVVYVSTNFIVYRDQTDRNALSDEDIRTLVDGFESKIDLEREFFGRESDLDQNGKIGIVYSSALNNLGGFGGIVTGYFYAVDFYPNFPESNCGEFVYSHVPGRSISRGFFMSNTGPTVLPHEVQHAINYNQHVFVGRGTSSDAGPHNEGKSHFAEDILNDFASTSAENPSRVELCLSFPLSAFIEGTGLAERGCAYLYYRYLYEQADQGRFPGVKNGKELIKKTEATALRGFEAIESAIGQSAKEISADFFIALYLSGTGLSSNPKYNFTGINLRGSQNDNRGTVLSGPGVSFLTSLPISRSVSAMSSDYALINGYAIKQAGNTLKLNVPASGNIRAAIIRIPDDQ